MTEPHSAGTDPTSVRGTPQRPGTRPQSGRDSGFPSGAAPMPWALPDPGTEDERPEAAEPQDPEERVEDVLDLHRWLRQVDVYTGPDALLDFNPVDNVHIDLTESNPSGFAQLLAGRRTRLSTILQNRQALAQGMRAARAIRAKTFELDADHGLDAGFLAAGTASWITHDPRTGAEKRFIAPVLLVPVAINPHRDGDDFELRVHGAARLNPALVRQLRREHGIDLVAEGVERRASSGSRLTPEPVLEAVRALCAGVRGMHVEARTVVSTFADLSDTVGPLPETASDGLLHELSALAAADRDPEAEAPAPRPDRTEVLSSDKLDPAEEVLVYDADESVSAILQRARAGESLAVTAPAGTAPLQAATNTVAALAADGKSVLVLAERRETLQEMGRRLGDLGLSDLVLRPGTEYEREALRDRLVAGIVAHEQSQAPDLEAAHRQLVGARDRLAAHVRSLHHRDSRWGVSPYQAMQTLAELTAKDPAPSTTVRFKRAVLDATLDRDETVAQLERAAELRAFRPEARQTPWFGARLANEDETRRARALVRHLLQSTRDLGRRLGTALGAVGLRRTDTLEGWRAQLELLAEVRESLARFDPSIFDRPVTDLIAATASTAWRRDRGIEMSAIQRSKLRRAAKEFILPQVSIVDLHDALVSVQDQRERWQEWAEDHREVSVPTDLDGIRADYDALAEEYSGLAIVMEESPHRLDWFAAPVSEVTTLLESMAGDRFLLDTLPERAQLLNVLRGKGLQELLADLERRQVPMRHVGDELDLAWWQSAFEVMLAGPDIDLVTGAKLSEWEAAYRRADIAHTAAGPARVRHGAARGWNRRINLKPVQAQQFRKLLKGAPAPLEAYLDQTPEILAGVAPIWLASPFAVGRALPQGTRVDAVVVLDAESTPLGACLAALARTDQVLAFGDEHAGFPRPFIVSPTLSQDQQPSTEPVDSVQQVLGRILPGAALTRVFDSREACLTEWLNDRWYDGALTALPWGEEITEGVRSLHVDYLHQSRPDDHVGAPVLDSPSAEVRAVVEMVLDHAARRPGQSLAVLTATARHAARITEALRVALGERPEAAAWFVGGEEPFRILALDRAHGLRRDRIIFSLGVAPQAGERPEHFGLLSGRYGTRRLVAAMTAARFGTRIVSSLGLSDLREASLSDGSEALLDLLERYRRESGAREETSQNVSGADSRLLDSRFLSVYDPSEDEKNADWLLADLGRRLRLGGAEISLTPGGTLDVVATSAEATLSAGAVPSPRVRTAAPGRSGPVLFPLGMSTDGTEAYAKLSVRERSRLRPELLERIGWNHRSVWTVDVFADPQAVADRSLKILGLEAEEEPGTGRPAEAR